MGPVLVNNICNYIAILQGKFLCANQGRCKQREGYFRDNEYWKEYVWWNNFFIAWKSEGSIGSRKYSSNILKPLDIIKNLNQIADLFDNDFLTKIFNISQQHNLVH